MICGFIAAQTVEKSYSFSNPKVTALRGYQQIQLEGCIQSAVVGQPSLPWQNVSLLLPQGTEAESIEVELSDFQEIEGNINLFPYQPCRTTNDTEKKWKDGSEGRGHYGKIPYACSYEGFNDEVYQFSVGLRFTCLLNFAR